MVSYFFSRCGSGPDVSGLPPSLLSTELRHPPKVSSHYLIFPEVKAVDFTPFFLFPLVFSAGFGELQTPQQMLRWSACSS